MAFWQGVQLNFWKSEVRDTAGRFGSSEAKFFTPEPLKWEHWCCASALSEKLYCPQFILDVLGVKLQIKQGCHCFCKKQPGHRQRVCDAPMPSSFFILQTCSPFIITVLSPHAIRAPSQPSRQYSSDPGSAIPCTLDHCLRAEAWCFHGLLNLCCVGKIQPETCARCLTDLHPNSVIVPGQRERWGLKCWQMGPWTPKHRCQGSQCLGYPQVPG